MVVMSKEIESSSCVDSRRPHLRSRIRQYKEKYTVGQVWVKQGFADGQRSGPACFKGAFSLFAFRGRNLNY